MKVTAFLLFVICMQATAKSVAQQKINLSGKNVSLSTVFNQIRQQTGYLFFYEDKLLDNANKVSIHLKDATLEKALVECFKNQPLSYSVVGKTIVVKSSKTISSAPTGSDNNFVVAPAADTIHIHVTDSAGHPLHGANVTVKGAPGVGQTDENGNITLIEVPHASTVIVSYIGYNPEIIKTGKQKNISVQLNAKENELNDVSLVYSNGYQKISKERATGAYYSISDKELAKIPVPNVIQRMEGLIPGVKVNVMAGDRSFDYANTQMSINGGTRTVGQNDYNISIRGNSTLQAETFPLVVIDGAISDIDLSALNPDDIQNITFLKDAAASSIYGIRAANGVIVVTTKKGSYSEPKISFSTNYTIAGKPDLSYLRMMNSAQELDYEKELVDRGFINQYNFDTSMYYSSYYPHLGAQLAYQLQNGQISQDAYNHATDSLGKLNNLSQISKYLISPASSQTYNLSISGGTKTSSYYYSAAYSKEIPNEKGDEGQRLTVNLNNKWTLFKVATLSTSFKGSFFKYKDNGLSYTSLFKQGNSTLLPYEMLADAQGNGISYNRRNPGYVANLQSLSSNYKNWTYNYLDELQNADNVQKDNTYVANIQLNVPIYKGLAADVLYSNERTYSNTREYDNPQTYYYRNLFNTMYNPFAAAGQQFNLTDGGIYSLINTTVNNYVFRTQLTYNRTFNKDNEVNALGGIELRQTQEGQGDYTLYGYNPETGLSTGVNYGANAYINALGSTTTLEGAPEQLDKRRRYLSYFGNASYTYKNKYTLSGSVRYDDYNNFGLDKKYRATPLWSSGLKWDIYKEDFMKSINWIDQLSLRGTFGVDGNISTTIYPFTYIQSPSADNSTGLPSSSIIAPANPDLRWEKTYETNIGLDFSIFRHIFSGSVDFYTKRGRDLLYSFPINAAYIGNISTMLTRNASSMNGKGLDLTLNANIVSNKDWNWSTGIVFSYNTNKITDSHFDTSSILASNKSYYPRSITNVNGYATDELFVFRNAGLDSAGSTLVYNAAGNKINYSNPVYFKDLKAAGRTTAPYYGSWNTTVRYKAFSLYVLATYQFGGVFLRPTIDYYITSYYSLNYDVNEDVAKRWKQSGDENKTNVPGLNGSATQVNYSLDRYQTSDINVLSSDYIRLREVSLSYALPASILPKKAVKAVTLSLAVRNLGLIWKANDQGYDPDFVSGAGSSYGLPARPSYTFSLNANF